MYAIIEQGVVVNTIEWDGVKDFTIPSKQKLVLVAEGQAVETGTKYVDGQFLPFEKPNGPSAKEILIFRRERMKVTRYQGKAALLRAGLLDQVESAVAASDDGMLKLAWAEAGFERLSLFAEQMKALTGQTDEELDEMFKEAAAIK